MRSGCSCSKEQHYVYRWHELHRLHEARRYDRPGSGSWVLAARQRYRYDGANQRVIKQTFDTSGDHRAALYVYGGDFERRGLRAGTSSWNLIPGETETQYLIAGARVVWKNRQGISALIDPEQRITYAIANLIDSTSAVVDLVRGELIEVGGFCPNGAREQQLGAADEVGGANVPLEPVGFTGKEADEEVGLTYFGERYLVQRIGRWATPDPLSVHAMGGGEALNAFHYVSGNLLQARDPLGMNGVPMGVPPPAPRPMPGGGAGNPIVQLILLFLYVFHQEERHDATLEALQRQERVANAKAQLSQRSSQWETDRAYSTEFSEERFAASSSKPLEVRGPEVVGQPPGNADSHWKERSSTVVTNEIDRRANGGGAGGANRVNSAAGVQRTAPESQFLGRDLQAAADLIHGALNDEIASKNRTTTVTESLDLSGAIAYTVTSSTGRLTSAQQQAARALLGSTVRMPSWEQGKLPNNRHHAEQRGLEATAGHTNVRQASSSGARHGGAACPNCAAAQQGAGVVENPTGTQEGGGRQR